MYPFYEKHYHIITNVCKINIFAAPQPHEISYKFSLNVLQTLSVVSITQKRMLLCYLLELMKWIFKSYEIPAEKRQYVFTSG